MSQAWEDLLPPPSGSKEERFHRVAWAVAVTLLRSGPDGLKIADVARRAGVSRAWIYKYLGNDTDLVLDFAVRLFGEAFAAPPDAAPPADVAAWRASIVEGTREGLRDVLSAPWCVLVYVRYRHAPGRLGDGLRAVEEAEIARFVARMPEPLRSHPSAHAFAAVYTAARLGVFHHWLDPRVRERIGEDRAVAEVLRMADGFLAEVGPLGRTTDAAARVGC